MWCEISLSACNRPLNYINVIQSGMPQEVLAVYQTYEGPSKKEESKSVGGLG